MSGSKSKVRSRGRTSNEERQINSMSTNCNCSVPLGYATRFDNSRTRTHAMAFSSPANGKLWLDPHMDVQTRSLQQSPTLIRASTLSVCCSREKEGDEDATPTRLFGESLFVWAKALTVLETVPIVHLILGAILLNKVARWTCGAKLCSRSRLQRESRTIRSLDEPTANVDWWRPMGDGSCEGIQWKHSGRTHSRQLVTYDTTKTPDVCLDRVILCLFSVHVRTNTSTSAVHYHFLSFKTKKAPRNLKFNELNCKKYQEFTSV